MNPPQYINTLNKYNNFLFVGGIKTKKGIEELIEAFIEYKISGGMMTLKLVGYCTPQYKVRLEKTLFKYNILEEVEFLGKQDDVSLLMNRA